MKHYTPIQALELMRDKLLIQNCQSMTEDLSECALRGTDGNKCAVGMLIDDEHFTEGMNGQNVYTLSKVFSDEQMGFNLSELLPECSAAMMLHDDRTPEYWKAGFEKLIENELNKS